MTFTHWLRLIKIYKVTYDIHTLVFIKTRLIKIYKVTYDVHTIV